MAALLWQSCLETSWQHFRNYAFTCWSCPVANIFSQDKATNSWPLSSEWAWSIQRYSKLDDWNVEHVLVMTKMTRMSGLLEALAMRFANQGGWRPCNKISNEAFVWIFYIVMQLSFMSAGFVVTFFPVKVFCHLRDVEGCPSDQVHKWNKGNLPRIFSMMINAIHFWDLILFKFFLINTHWILIVFFSRTKAMYPMV